MLAVASVRSSYRFRCAEDPTGPEGERVPRARAKSAPQLCARAKSVSAMRITPSCCWTSSRAILKATCGLR